MRIRSAGTPSARSARTRSTVARDARTVVQQLLDGMTEIVRDYHPDVGRTELDVEKLLRRTSFFPGGFGLWCEDQPRDDFPNSPIMFVAHNYDSIEAYERDRSSQRRPWKPWREVVLPLLEQADVDPSDVFFTNALMGCKPGSATGAMPTVEGYEEQCQRFLARQIEIVGPRAVVALGGAACTRLRRVSPGAGSIYHPSARQFNKLSTRAEFIRKQADRLREIILRTV